MTENEVKSILHMSNVVYDRLKFIALVLLPALGTLYFALAQGWGLGYAEQILGTVLALEVFLGSLLGLSNRAHKQEVADRVQSHLIVDGEGGVYAEFGFDPNDLADGEIIEAQVLKAQS